MRIDGALLDVDSQPECVTQRPRSASQHLTLTLLLFLGTWSCVAQTASERSVSPTRPTQLPLSGREAAAAGVTVNQRTTNSGGANTVDVINSTVTVQAPYNGSMPTGPLSSTPIVLTLEEALRLGLRANLGALSQAAAVQQAQGQRLIARSELLPTVNTVVSEAFEKINLRTLGVSESSFPLTSKFNYYDARAARLSQSVFDLVRIRNLQGSTENVRGTIKAARNARDLIVLAVGGAYLQLVTTRARIQATAAQVEIEHAVYQQAADRLAAGLAPRIDVTRSRVQLQTEQQRLRSLQADLETGKLRLARVIGLPLGQRFSIEGEYKYAPLTDYTVDGALKTAFLDRPDLQAADASLRSAELAVKAARAERLPSVGVMGDFGAAGVTPTNKSVGVFSVSGTLTVPLYEGGRIRGDIEQASAVVRQRKAEMEDLRGQIDQDVRQAFIDLDSAADQVAVAQSNVALAHDTLTQSRDRFAAGIADTVEVVQAEQSVVQADDDQITAIYEHNLAKVSLARAMGNAEQTLPRILRK